MTLRTVLVSKLVKHIGLTWNKVLLFHQYSLSSDAGVKHSTSRPSMWTGAWDDENWCWQNHWEHTVHTKQTVTEHIVLDSESTVQPKSVSIKCAFTKSSSHSRCKHILHTPRFQKKKKAWAALALTTACNLYL